MVSSLLSHPATNALLPAVLPIAAVFAISPPTLEFCANNLLKMGISFPKARLASLITVTAVGAVAITGMCVGFAVSLPVTISTTGAYIAFTIYSNITTSRRIESLYK